MFKTDFILANVAFFVNVISRKKNAAATVARGPVPSDLSAETRNVRSPEAMDVCCHDRCMARETRSDARVASEGPRPTVKGDVLSPVARGPVPRDLSAETRNVRSPEAMDVCCHDRCMARETRSDARMASEGPSPTVKGTVLIPVARGPVPRERWHGEGQTSGQGCPSYPDASRDRCMAREPRSHARVACEGPSPTGTGKSFGIRASSRELQKNVLFGNLFLT